MNETEKEVRRRKREGGKGEGQEEGGKGGVEWVKGDSKSYINL